jgi:hypothetical protein
MTPPVCLPTCRYEEAHGVLKLVMKSSQDTTDHKSIKQLLSIVEQRLKEQSQGVYEFERLFRVASAAEIRGEAVRYDVAEYIGPVQQVVVEGKGRGLVASRDIAPGELVMAIKAEDIVGHAEVSAFVYLGLMGGHM